MRRPRTGRRHSRFLRDEDGATAIEYAMIAAGISVAIVTSVTSVSSNMMTMFYDKLVGMF